MSGDITVPAALAADLRRQAERARDPLATPASREMAAAILAGMVWSPTGATCPHGWRKPDLCPECPRPGVDR